MKTTTPMRHGEFIALTACIMLLTAVAIDIMLPAFDALREHFGLGAESTATAQIVTFFFLGQIGQLVYGPLSDRFGRLAVLRAGFVLYIIGSFAAGLAPSLNAMFAARFVVGLGAAALTVGAVAGVRDRFAGDKMARTMSLVMTIFLIVPVIAPIAGAAILSASSWQVVFLTPPVIAVAVFLWSLRLDESLPAERRVPLDVPTLIRSARQVFGNWTFVRYTAITTILFAPFTSYIGSSERVISEIYGRPDLFVWIFGAIGIVLAIFSFSNAQLVGRLGALRSIWGLLSAHVLLSCALLVLTLALGGVPNIVVFFAFLALMQGIYVALSSNTNALAMEPLGSVAGMAAAINGTSFFVVGSMVGSSIDRLLVDTLTPLAAAYVIAGVISLVLMVAGRTRTASPAVNRVVEGAPGD